VSTALEKPAQSEPKTMIPVTKPTLPPYADVEPQIREIFETGLITNGKYVRAFEEKACAFLGARRVVSAPSCTAGLMALLSTLPTGSEVIIPAFTFSATYQALLWNHLRPVLVDCNESCNIDVTQIEPAVTERTSAILAVHMYGTATDIEVLQDIASRNQLPLFYDAAHAFGARYKGRYLGTFGAAEVFSLGPTKTLPIGEGALLAFQDETLAERVRLICNHGQPSNSLDSVVKSFNGRLEEINAAIGIRLLDDVDRWVGRRQELARAYYDLLHDVPGITFPEVPPHATSTYKDFCVFVDESHYGMNRDALLDFLAAAGVQTKRYFHPPIHHLTVARSEFAGVRLPNTELKSSRVLALPMYSHMPVTEVEYVCDAVRAGHGGALS
jgi:dTDP-4-amino-4,6-dideoxygalactose transaminase